ncbi:PEPxxWA-CTERM sorting domain-containing protein [Kordiimonas sp. SCSIO 12610]|uniref:PEPxxWA-CTERM sorting domain-containing protein n=1 Tax=Kordiimonas sp. SCSIO 12610 TaxID=2829597 RepID=UPI00210BF3C1|nr:PEPxxWA-CTERM sorting domain-containing protein [Kordiimonas sp. SCSIO 12610]UTW54376.1 PEP-CTERM sorting domain-containing protein [Kordiimonas sp. SCSIO 12610]
MKKIYMSLASVLFIGTAVAAQNQTFRFQGEVGSIFDTSPESIDLINFATTFTGQFTINIGTEAFSSDRRSDSSRFLIQQSSDYEFTNLTFRIGDQELSYQGNSDQGNFLRVTENESFRGGFRRSTSAQLLLGEDMGLSTSGISNLFFILGSTVNLPTSSTAPSRLMEILDSPLVGTGTGFISFQDNRSVSLRNISYSLISGIPEPSTWLMMIIGFAVAGLQLKRRRFVSKQSA